MAPSHLTPKLRQYAQQMSFTLKLCADANHGQDASAVIVDWLGAGRIAAGERWAFDEYSSRFEFVWQDSGDSAKSRLVEALRLRTHDCKFLDNPLQSFDAFVTIFASGPRAAGVITRMKNAALLLAARAGARVRAPASLASLNTDEMSLPRLKGKAVLGVTTDEKSGCTVARLMAENTEDVYRLLQACLAPLASFLGAEPYADRVHGAGPFEISQRAKHRASEERARTLQQGGTHAINLQQQFALCHLTDSLLPVGGFAHSGGIEAALQLGLLSRQEGEIDELQNFIKMLALSTLRLQGNFARSAHKLGVTHLDTGALTAWQDLNEDLHAHLAGGLACRASLLQGAGLGRIGRRWCADNLPKSGHFASLFGLLCARCGPHHERA